MTHPLSNEPTRFRTALAKGGSPKVDRAGGMFGEGLIEGVSVITRGEALGHGLWCDHQFLESVTSELNLTNGGIKARFTHPGLSSDGVGTKLGKFTNARKVGDQVLADLHFQSAARKTPDGDLADYVMTLAEETPEDFGMSIVFDFDEDASMDHQKKTFVNGKSPDPDNTENYPHARLSKLYACDAVDSPAANPNGLFKRGQDAAMEAEKLVEYTLGLSGEKPEVKLFNVDGDRVKQFLERFLTSHKLRIVKEDDMSGSNSDAPAADRAVFTAELKRYTEAFGAVNGAEWFTSGVSFEDAQGKYIAQLKTGLAEKDKTIAELNARIEAVQKQLGEEKGPEFSSGESKDKPKERKGKIRIAGKNYE